MKIIAGYTIYNFTGDEDKLWSVDSLEEKDHILLGNKINTVRLYFLI